MMMLLFLAERTAKTELSGRVRIFFGKGVVASHYKNTSVTAKKTRKLENFSCCLFFSFRGVKEDRTKAMNCEEGINIMVIRSQFPVAISLLPSFLPPATPPLICPCCFGTTLF